MILTKRRAGPARALLPKWLVMDRYLYLMLIPGLLSLLIFSYIPMGGIIIAFKEYNIFKGFLGSDWVGLDNFNKLFITRNFWNVFRNTFLISLYKLIFGFPVPLILSLLLNELRNKAFKRTIQTVLYLPHFISWVIVGGIMLSLFSINYGLVGEFFKITGMTPVNVLASQKYFRSILVLTDIWKGAGWGTIIYLAAFSQINPNLYEAAVIDGAGRLRRMLNITLPSISGVISLLLVLSIGSLMSAGFEQILVMQNSMVLDVSDIFDTYVLRTGLGRQDYSFATAVNLFKSVIGTALILFSDFFSRKLTGEGLFT